MPAGLLKLAKATVKLSHNVTAVQRSGSSWKVVVGGAAAHGVAQSSGDSAAAGVGVGGWWGDDKYDAVIIAAPLQQSGISVEGLDDTHGNSDPRAEVPGDTVDYQTVYTTYVKAKLRQEYFNPHSGLDAAEQRGVQGASEPEDLPGFIATAEGSTAGFSCIGTLNASVDGEGTRLMKLFSREKLSPALLERVFVGAEVPAEERWKAYPVFRVPEREEGRMRLSAGLYYANALEAGASCVEVAAVAARNVVALLMRDLARGAVADGVAAAERAAADTLRVQQEL